MNEDKLLLYKKNVIDALNKFNEVLKEENAVLQNHETGNIDVKSMIINLDFTWFDNDEDAKCKNITDENCSIISDFVIESNDEYEYINLDEYQLIDLGESIIRDSNLNNNKILSLINKEDTLTFEEWIKVYSVSNTFIIGLNEYFQNHCEKWYPNELWLEVGGDIRFDSDDDTDWTIVKINDRYGLYSSELDKMYSKVYGTLKELHDDTLGTEYEEIIRM